MRAGTSGGMPRHNDALQASFGDAQPAEYFDSVRGTGPDGAPLQSSNLHYDLGAAGVCVDTTSSRVCDPSTNPTWLSSTGATASNLATPLYMTGTGYVVQNAHSRRFWQHAGGGPGLTAYWIVDGHSEARKSDEVDATRVVGQFWGGVQRSSRAPKSRARSNHLRALGRREWTRST